MTIRSCFTAYGLGYKKVHAMRPDGTAACSNFLDVSVAEPAHTVPIEVRCKSRPCRKLFAEADAAAAKPSGEENK